MLRALVGILSFIVTFFIGFLLVPNFQDVHHIPLSKMEAIVTATPANIAVRSKTEGDEFDPEFRDLPNYDDIVYPEGEDLIDVFETGGIYRESEVIAKTGQNWLTLFERNGKYSLAIAGTKVTKKRTISYPGDDFDVQLSFDKSGVPIFAVGKLKGLKPGAITTLYHRPSSEEIDRRNLPIEAMKTGFKREFNLNDNWYTLRVSQGLTKNGATVGVLVLENNKMSQVIAQNYHDPKHGEIIGELFWVGDLDNDGKLDLYFDEFNEKGAFGVGLYLSSHAEPDGLVKLAAIFGTAGC